MLHNASAWLPDQTNLPHGSQMRSDRNAGTNQFTLIVEISIAGILTRPFEAKDRFIITYLSASRWLPAQVTGEIVNMPIGQG